MVNFNATEQPRYAQALQELQTNLDKINNNTDHNQPIEKVLSSKAHALAAHLVETKTNLAIIPPHKICEALGTFCLTIGLQNLVWDFKSFLRPEDLQGHCKEANDKKIKDHHSHSFSVFSGFLSKNFDDWKEAHNAFVLFKKTFAIQQDFCENLVKTRKVLKSLLPYFSVKNEIKNYNIKFDFLGLDSANNPIPEKIVCRHLATVWALDYLDFGKPAPFKSKDDIQARNPIEIELVFNYLVKHSSACHSVANEKFGIWLSDQLKILSAEQPQKSFLLCTITHAIAIGIKLKIKNNQIIYVLHCFDPNITTNQARLEKLDIGDFIDLDLSSLLPADAYWSYYGQYTKHSLLIEVPSPSFELNALALNSEKYPTMRVLKSYQASEFNRMSEDALLSLLINGLGDLQLYRDLFNAASLQNEQEGSKNPNYKFLIRTEGRLHIELWVKLETQQLQNRKSVAAIEEFDRQINGAYEVLGSMLTTYFDRLKILRQALKGLKAINATAGNGWNSEAMAALENLKASIVEKLDKHTEPIEPKTQPAEEGPVSSLPSLSRRRK